MLLCICAVFCVAQNLYPYCIEEYGCGYVDKKLAFVIEPKFDKVWKFGEGLAAVKIGEKRGFINEKGEFAIEAKFDAAGSFSHSLAPVKLEGKYGLINKNAEFIVEPTYTHISDFSKKSGLAMVDLNDKCGFINTKGEVAIDIKFEHCGEFYDGGLAAVKSNGKWGYIDTKGEFVIEPKFDLAISFVHNNFAWVKVGELWGALNKKGKFVIEPAYIEVQQYANGYTSVVQQQYRYLNVYFFDKNGEDDLRVERVLHGSHIDNSLHAHNEKGNQYVIVFETYDHFTGEIKVADIEGMKIVKDKKGKTLFPKDLTKPKGEIEDAQKALEDFHQKLASGNTKEALESIFFYKKPADEKQLPANEPTPQNITYDSATFYDDGKIAQIDFSYTDKNGKKIIKTQTLMYIKDRWRVVF
jgi:hypothetical protein